MYAHLLLAYTHLHVISYSRKYWWELKLAVEPQIAIIRILAVRYYGVPFVSKFIIGRYLEKSGDLRN